MATTITAGNATNGAAITPDNTGILELKTGTGSGTTAVTIGTGQDVTFAQAANLPNTFGFKNRIINGAMVIDQRNAGASVTPTNGQFTVDRWASYLTQASKYSVQQNAGSVTPPAGFSNYLGITSSSAYSVLTGDTFFQYQMIEGFNFADMAWGTASAATVTLSFWVRSSLTGTFGGALTNSAANRSYPFSYTISSANTWEQKTITIAGDTSGTWVGATNGIGAVVRFGLGSGSTFTGTAGAWAASNLVQPTGSVSVVGTNGATFYITGVQLEKGSTATSFDVRPYGTELALCQRYYYRSTANTGGTFGAGWNESTTTSAAHVQFPVPMRAVPASLEQGGTASDYRIAYLATATVCSSVPTFISSSVSGSRIRLTVASGLTAGQGSSAASAVTGAYLAWSAEL